MHRLFQKGSALTENIIGGAIEVHRDKGPGLIESIYEWCLTKELELRRLACIAQKQVTIEYKGFLREEILRFDLLVEDSVLVEVKAVTRAASELHEDPRYSTGAVDQLPRSKTYQWGASPDPARRK